MLTLVERRSGYAVIKKRTARTARQVTWNTASAIVERARKIRTITFDNGTEFHDYKTLAELFPVKCYFATPCHSWERGNNESLNGLIRQYVPEGICIKTLTQKDCDRIAYELNARPRKRHGFKTPLEIYHGS